LSPIINAWLGWRYQFARRYDQAIVEYRKSLDLDPNFAPAHLVLGQAYEQKGMLKEAAAELEHAVTLSGCGAIYLASLAHAYSGAARLKWLTYPMPHFRWRATVRSDNSHQQRWVISMT
jgi:tetratricopeptide (TPR) repeat protein